MQTVRLTGIGVGVLLLVASCSSTVGDSATTISTIPSLPADPGELCPTEGEVLETAKLYIEHNATDADTGVHGLFGGSAWSELCIWDPNGNLVMVVDPRNALGDLTVADLFFESREPPNDEYSLDNLKSDFPEGTYTVGGTDFEGVARVGKATFSHAIPEQPKVTNPTITADEESAEDSTVNTSDVVVKWEPVTTDVDGAQIDLTGYQVIVTKVDHDDPNGSSRPVYDVHVGPGLNQLAVPEGFFEPATTYELEVLALEASGNQTITVGFFTTE